jgi:hypothetical protein
MTEKEKMIAGLLYDCTDDELMELKPKLIFCAKIIMTHMKPIQMSAKRLLNNFCPIQVKTSICRGLFSLTTVFLLLLEKIAMQILIL